MLSTFRESGTFWWYDWVAWFVFGLTVGPLALWWTVKCFREGQGAVLLSVVGISLVMPTVIIIVGTLL